MKRPGATIALAALLLTAACTSEADRTVELRVLSSDPAVIARTDEVLLSRFGMFNSAMFRPVASEIDGSRLTYTFPGETPDGTTIANLAEWTGLITLTLEGASDPIISSADIESIDSRYDDSGNKLFSFVLTPDAGERMLQTTSDNLGRRIILKMDDTVLTDATIRGVFARQFQLTGTDLQNFDRIYAAIRFGPLPAQVEVVSFQTSARPD